MSYIDDWGNTSAYEIAQYKRQCENPWCGHARVRHGDARRVRGYGIEYTPGKCEQCRCPVFADNPPVTEDDLLHAHGLLKIPGSRLSDFGIEPLPPDPETKPDPEAW